MRRSLIIFSVFYCSYAFGAQTFTQYVCKEQRSVGWEKKEDGSYKIGKFNIDLKTFIVRYKPADTSEYDTLQILTIPTIEIPMSNGEIRVLTSDICNRSFEDRGVIDMRSQYVDGGRNCKLAIESNSQHPNRDESFDNSDLQFSKQLASRPITVTYIEKIAIADSDSYLSEGMCSLAN